MKLSVIQQRIKTLIEAAATGGSLLETVGITIEGELDGGGALVDFDEVIADGILERGIHIGIMHPSTGQADTAHNKAGGGISSMWTTVPVILAENPSINRDVGSGGLNRNPIEVVEAIMEAVLYKPTGPLPNGFRLADEPFFKAESEAGHQYFMFFQARTFFN